MDALQQKNLLLPETRRNLTNRLILITPKCACSSQFQKQPTLKSGESGNRRRTRWGNMLRTVLIWKFSTRSNRNSFSNNVRQVLTYVETGNVDAGIVYTDAKESKSVRVGATAQENLHSPVYPVAVLKDTKNAAARSLCNFCLALRH